MLPDPQRAMQGFDPLSSEARACPEGDAPSTNDSLANPGSSEFESGRTETWDVMALSVVGEGHTKVGQRCQDRVRFHLGADGVLIAAIADGAGSAEHSARGAELAVETSIRAILQFLETLDFRDESLLFQQSLLATALKECVLGRILPKLWEEATKLGVSVRALASTLTAIVLTPNWTGVIQVGDSFAVLRKVDDQYFVLCQPQKGEYVNETLFLTDRDVQSTACAKVFRGNVEFVAMASDGLAPLAFEGGVGQPHAPFFRKLEAFTRQLCPLRKDTEASRRKSLDAMGSELKQWLQSKDVCQRSDDDKTIFLAATPQPVTS